MGIIALAGSGWLIKWVPLLAAAAASAEAGNGAGRESTMIILDRQEP